MQELLSPNNSRDLGKQNQTQRVWPLSTGISFQSKIVMDANFLMSTRDSFTSLYFATCLFRMIPNWMGSGEPKYLLFLLCQCTLSSNYRSSLFVGIVQFTTAFFYFEASSIIPSGPWLTKHPGGKRMLCHSFVSVYTNIYIYTNICL